MLRQGSPDEIQHMFGRMKFENESMIKDLLQLAYFMRGVISYNDMFWISYMEREFIRTFLDKRMEMENGKPFPIY